MKPALKSLVAASVALAAVAASASSASAYIACNSSGDCWHVKRHGYYHYRPTYGVVVHPDNWRWRDNDNYRWREHRGRGYWRDGVWHRF